MPEQNQSTGTPGKIPKTYWFTIETYVHISIKKDNILLYNTLTGQALEYNDETHPNPNPARQKILRLLRRLQKPANLWVVRLNERDILDPDISAFVRAARKKFIGDLLDTNFSLGKPVQNPPIITIQKNAEKLKKDGDRSVGEDMMGYLAELFLYINSRCDRGCCMCAAAYRQFPCCTTRKASSHSPGEIEIQHIRDILDEAAGTSLVRVNILGGDVFTYSKFSSLIEMLDRHPANKTLYCHYENAASHSATEKLRSLPGKGWTIKIIVPPTTGVTINMEKLQAALDAAGARALVKAMFLFSNETQYEKAAAAGKELGMPAIEQPFFDGSPQSLDFFKQYIFLDKDEIFEAKTSLNDIYRNETVNSLNFGRLIVFANGHIHASANAPRLGILGKNSLYDVIYKETYHGKSWRRTRKKVTPCKHCTFHAVCPPLSNYTYAIGRNDLCFKYTP